MSRAPVGVPRRAWAVRQRAGSAVLAVLTAASLAGGCSPLRGYDQGDLQRDLDAIRNSGTVGVQVRLTRDGEVLVGTSGVADLGARRPVPLNGHYRIASNTKTFVATVVLQLVGEGRLTVDDTVEEHLPGVLGEAYDGDAITVRDLLRHTSGVYDYNDDEEWNPFASEDTFRARRFDRYEAEDLVAVAVRHPPEFAPGTAHRYANTNYVLAGMIVEAVTGRPWEEEVHERIVEPLALEGTTVPDGPRLPRPYARGYHQFEPGGPLVDATLLDPSAGDAGGAIVSTPEDMTRFFRALLGGELLTAGLLAQMQDTVPAGDGRYGLGLVWSPLSCGGGYWGHGGAVPGYASAEGFTEDGRRGIVLSLSSLHDDERRDAAQGQAVAEMIDNALCDR